MDLLSFALPDLSVPATAFLSGLLILVLRVVEMSIDCLRVVAIVRGRRLRAGIYGFFEAAIFIFAISQVLMPPIEWPEMLGYAAGFGAGTWSGSRLATLFSSEHLLVRVLARDRSGDIAATLREHGFGVTLVEGHGREGPLQILFCVVKRKQGKAVLELIRKVHEKALVVTEPLDHAVNAFVPRMARFSTGARR